MSEDGLVVVTCAFDKNSGALVTGPEIVTRGFIYAKEPDTLTEEMRRVALNAMERSHNAGITDWAGIKQNIKGDLSSYLSKRVKRNPMILPVFVEA
jgi:ribonuclease J